MMVDGNGGDAEEIDIKRMVGALFVAMTALAESQRSVVNLHGDLMFLLQGVERRLDELEKRFPKDN